MRIVLGTGQYLPESYAARNTYLVTLASYILHRMMKRSVAQRVKNAIVGRYFKTWRSFLWAATP